MTIEKMREEFEAWALKEFGLTPGHLIKDPEEDNEYGNYPTQCYWEVWQASRAALVIELPAGSTTPDGQSVALDGFRVRVALQAAGVKVKP